MNNSRRGFTIVELLIVIAVIAILSGLTMFAYADTQKRSRDSQRRQDIKIIANALELYYSDNGEYPRITNSGAPAVLNSTWSASNHVSWTQANTNVDGTWKSIGAALVPKYLASLPVDPINNASPAYPSVNPGGFSYIYTTGAYCGVASGQMYILAFRLEASVQEDDYSGSCSTSPIGSYANASEQRVRR